MNVLGGFLAAVAFAVAGVLLRHARRPFYVPGDLQRCSDRAKELLLRAGVGPGDVIPLDQVIWVQPHAVPDYLARGSNVVHVRPYFLKCEVRAMRSEGYTVLMTRPSR